MKYDDAAAKLTCVELDRTMASYNGVKRCTFDRSGQPPNTLCILATPKEPGSYRYTKQGKYYGKFLKDLLITQVEEYYREQFAASYKGMNFDMISVTLETKEVRLLTFDERRKVGKLMEKIGIIGMHYDRDLDYYETIVPLDSTQKIYRKRRDFLTSSIKEEVISADEFWAAVLERL